jgi:uncharacterized membrane protein
MRIDEAVIGSCVLVAACGSPDNTPKVASQDTSKVANSSTAPVSPPTVGGVIATPGRAVANRSPARLSNQAGACLMQDGQRLTVEPVRALGTEPFWGARIEGRCVTYSHPEDQKGTRVWTRYTPNPRGGTWSGAIGGKRFELRTAAQPGCSNGMSDRRYSIAIELLVNGERRTGCAEALQ